MKRRWQFWLKIGLGVLASWLIFTAGAICLYSTQSDASPADAAVVLGAAVWDGQPSPVFAERINHAIQLYHSKRVRVIIFTGGIGKDDLLAESAVARAYALQQGVGASDIFCEEISTTTYENLREAKVILDQNHFERVLVVSDPLHMKRAISIARDMGLAAYPSPTPTTRYISLQSRFVFLLRETYYYNTYLLRRVFGAAQMPAP